MVGDFFEHSNETSACPGKSLLDPGWAPVFRNGHAQALWQTAEKIAWPFWMRQPGVQ
jgi:hypothetical protein